ncbi:GatB/YqeY domain-containing protein [Crenalkalicoccus roseus]|uniref:GatB/YqeY domain-containing protein n=1 Tax=Crenalkalicoccus roseus TaxID=1485588 RepID=UPI0038D03E10
MMAEDLRSRLSEEMKAAMKAGDAARTSTIRMIMAKLKETDIAARPSGVERVPDEQIATMLRGMVKSRRESAELYRQGNRPELAEKEEAEIRVIESFLPRQMDEAAMREAIRAAIAESGASGVKEMGKVMALLRARHAASMDLSRAGPLVKEALGG